MSSLTIVHLTANRIIPVVFKLPEDLVEKLEKAAAAHPPRRVVNPSKRYNLPYDLYDDDGGVIVPDDDDLA